MRGSRLRPIFCMPLASFVKGVVIVFSCFNLPVEELLRSLGEADLSKLYFVFFKKCQAAFKNINKVTIFIKHNLSLRLGNTVYNKDLDYTTKKVRQQMF